MKTNKLLRLKPLKSILSCYELRTKLNSKILASRQTFKSSSNLLQVKLKFFNQREARAVDFVLFSAAKSTVSRAVRLRECLLGQLPVYNYLWVRNDIIFPAKLSNFTNFCFKCLLQLFHHLRNFIRHLKKASSDITTPETPQLRFGVWISDETPDTVSLIQLFCSWQSETFYPNLQLSYLTFRVKKLTRWPIFILQPLVVKNGVCPGPRKLPQSVNGKYGHSTQLGNGKGEFFSKIQKVLLLNYCYYYYCFCYCYYCYYFRTCIWIV